MSNSLLPHESQHARPPCPSPTPGVHLNSCPSSQWCHPAISSSVIPFSYPQSLPASGSFPMSQLFAWGGQSTGISALASVLPVNTQDWSPSEWTGWTSLQSKLPVCISVIIFIALSVWWFAWWIHDIEPVDYTAIIHLLWSRVFEWDRKPRKNPTHLWSISQQQRREDYEMLERQSLQQMILEKLDRYMRKKWN